MLILLMGVFEYFQQKMYDECCPVKTKQRSVKFRKQWMIPALLRSCKTKDNLFKKYQTFPTTENGVNTMHIKCIHIPQAKS